MSKTYTSLKTETIATPTSSITFDNISQAYTDLVVVLSVRGTTASNDIDIIGQFNSDSNSNYSHTRIYTTGSVTGSLRQTSATYLKIGNMAGSGYTAYSPMILNIQNYSNTTTHKTMLGRPNNPDRIVDGYVNLWRSTSAINSITFTSGSGNFDTGSTFSLYGIASAAVVSQGAKATGGEVVATDGTYWYHTFYSSGTFTPTEALTADYLVVAGGGGGGANRSGGGGGGGFRTSVGASTLSLGTSAYTVTVGAGGAGAVGPTRAAGTSGSNSVFSTITSTGGGGGGGATSNAVSGGSGGGSAPGYTAGLGNTPSTSPSQGNNGASGSPNSSPYPAGGGGGAGAVGVAGSGSTAGNGGAGSASSLSGSSVTYAGGGGGGIEGGSTAGTGGAGGGGNGSSTGNGSAGTANTGGGGGGSASTDAYNGGNGGSGIIIVRYPV